LTKWQLVDIEIYQRIQKMYLNFIHGADYTKK
jgi:hypothetical protein